MFRLSLLISAFFLASILAQGLGGLDGPDGDGGPNGGGGHSGKGKHKHHKKMMKCMKQTKKLQEECCPFPKDESVMEDPACKEHLDGIEDKEGKDKHEAMKCWMDCMYKAKGLIEGNELKKDAILEEFDEMLTKLEGEDFKAISQESIEFCHTEFIKKQEKFKQWMASSNKTHNDDGNGKKCSFIPGAFTMCIIGNVVRNCPESQWESTDDCNTLKSDATSMEDCMKH